MALSDMYRWPMFPANSGFLVNAQTGEHVKSVPVPQYLPEPTLEMIVNAVTGAPSTWMVISDRSVSLRRTNCPRPEFLLTIAFSPTGLKVARIYSAFP